MKDDSLNIKQILAFGGAFIGFTTGAGFSSGQEILQFFTAYGYQSIWVVAICMAIFIWYGYCLLEKGRVLQLDSSYDIFKYYCGTHLGKFFEWFTMVFLFSVVIIMISGAGSAVNQYYGLPNVIGRLLMSTLILFTVLSGLEKLVQVIGKLGPVIASIALMVGIVSVVQNFDGLMMAGDVIKTINVPKATPSWFVASILYPSYTIVGITPFLTSLGKNADSQKTTLGAGIFGGITLLTAALMLNLGMLSNIEAVSSKSIPVLFLAGKISPLLGVGFSIVLISGMYSTSVPMMWSLCSKFAKDGTKRYKIFAITLVTLAFFGGALPFEKLVGTIYPITGYMGLFLIVGMIYRMFINPGDDLKIQ